MRDWRRTKVLQTPLFAERDGLADGDPSENTMANRTYAPDIVIALPYYGLTTFGVLVLPVVIAIWGIPSFVTQDGPSHLYNAHLINELLRGYAPARDVYRLSWMPMPNLAGHWLLVALMQIVSARTAGRLFMTFTWLGPTSTVVWLRWCVAGSKGIALIAPLAVFIASSYLWLLGFYNFLFLLGVCLFPVTLGYWGANRQGMQVKKSAILGGLLDLGYLCHLVGAALTVFALVLLTLTTPGTGYLAPYRWTAIGLTPLVPLGLVYYRLRQAADKIRPVWKPFPQNFWSPHERDGYLESGNPFSILAVYAFPFINWTSWWFRFLQPSVWVVAG